MSAAARSPALLLVFVLAGCAHPVIAGAAGFGPGVPLDCTWHSPDAPPECHPTDDLDPRRFDPVGGRYADVPDCKMTAIGVSAPASRRPTFLAACGPRAEDVWSCPTVPAGGEPGAGSRVPACVSDPPPGVPLRPLPPCNGRIVGLRVDHDLLAICAPPEN